MTNATIEAKPVRLEVKSFEGETSGSQNLALRVAADNTAKGLVHRYLVTVRQNARAVSPRTHISCHQLDLKRTLQCLKLL